MTRWQFWIDRGGTFTDVVGRRPDGSILTMKLLSENPEQYEDAAIEGIRRALGLKPHERIGPERVEVVRMGTTVATNALLERTGEPLLLAVTRGFRDALRIASQNRPRLFEREIVLPEMLYREVVEIDERIGADGAVVQALDEDSARRALAGAHARGLHVIAIVLMHGYRYPAHEQRLAQLARDIGFTQISVSHLVSPQIRYIGRGDTTVVDAYLSPVLRRYVERVAAAMPGVRLQFMQSHGGLTDAAAFQGKDSILSGPAGGIVGMARVSAAAGFGRVIGFDMGGTSTDVSHFAGEYEREFDTLVAGVRIRAPMLGIHTVAAGGGSILHFDGARLRVGPESAGADPGPACYRRGGPLTVTDANLLLGRIQPAFFPPVFGPQANEALDERVVRHEFTALAARVSAESRHVVSAEQLAQGFLEIAVANMANAIRRISVQRGYDVTRYTLTTFGGAGGQHACAVADVLTMPRVLVHPHAGVLSAWGMGLADPVAMREESIERPLDDAGLATARERIAVLAQAARRELLEQGEAPAALHETAWLTLRYEGTDTALPVSVGERRSMHAAFEDAWRQRFSFLLPGRALLIEAAVVEVSARQADGQTASRAAGAATPAPVAAARGDTGQQARQAAAQDAPRNAEAPVPTPVRQHARLYLDGGWREVPLFERAHLQAGGFFDGPAIVVEANATTVVDPGWRAGVTADGNLLLERHEPRTQRRAPGTAVDPVRLEIYNNLFMSIAEQMGLRLQNTAHSVNIKERLDFSCAIFDARGHLVANAPHIPVHLGSMGASVRAILARHGGGPAGAGAAPGAPLAPGDVYVLNDPYAGGTHLPDVTVITPVFGDDGREILFFIGSRGHHADIGGRTPGSMPPDSVHIDEEGVLLTDFLLVSAGTMREDALRAVLRAARWPARNPEQNLADLRAQIAANEKGREELLALVRESGRDVVLAYMGHVQDNAEESVRRVIGALHDGAFAVQLDNGATIRVRIDVDRARRSARIDFAGTSAQQPNNFNAPLAVTTAAVLYVFRTLVGDEIPLNEGCLVPVQIRVPEGSMLNPRAPAAVVAGNVETSQCITNCLYGALGVMASAAPTMNNFTFGNERHQYYETIAGGSGAGGRFDEQGRLVGGFDGTSAVQTHMTNSRLTDPEILETRYPVRLESFAIRTGSGGPGRWHGGDGTVRRIRFLEPMNASILANGRLHPAFGLCGGGAGAVGRDRVERADGRIECLAHADSARLEPGDLFVIETPGGGGFG